jgi:hypothetical protein
VSHKLTIDVLSISLSLHNLYYLPPRPWKLEATPAVMLVQMPLPEEFPADPALEGRGMEKILLTSSLEIPVEIPALMVLTQLPAEEPGPEPGPTPLPTPEALLVPEAEETPPEEKLPEEELMEEILQAVPEEELPEELPEEELPEEILLPEPEELPVAIPKAIKDKEKMKESS